MNFDEMLEQVLALVQRQGRVSYRAIKRRLDVDDDFLEDLKEELLFTHRQIVDEDGRGLVWRDDAEVVSAPAASSPQPVPQPVADEAPSTAIEPAAAPLPSNAERRQLTVMFCDLADSTRLSGQLDPEDLRDVIRAYQSTSAEVIERFDGYIAQHLGDGLMVYFGWPQAHEDDAQRAVHTGLGILEAMAGLNAHLEQEKGIRLTVRVGIHIGLVVVGEIGKGASQEHLALGETPNIASRIEGIAEPDTVAISAATYRLIHGYFVCQDLGQYAFKGLDEPQQVHRVLRESGAQSRLDVGVARGLTPLVGRESEVTLLLERWEQVKGGQGQVALLSGEAGIGKSRLVQILKEHMAHDRHTLQECRCSPYHTQSALFPLIDLLQRKLHWQAEDTAQEKLHKLEVVLAPTHLDIETALPLFASWLSLPLPEGRYAPLTLSSQRQRQEILLVLLQLFALAAEHHPVVFILEDLHWADPSTLEFLDLLLNQTPTTAILTVLTCRPEFQSPWGLRSYLTPIALKRFTRSQSEQMVERVTSGKRLPAEIMQQLVEKTDGVPLYIEEMTKAILEAGILREANGEYELLDRFSALAIPSTLQDSLMARLDRLMTAKVIAQLGATIGRQFSYALLHAVSQVDEATLQRELGRLVEAELVYQRGLPPQATYTFRHALIQDAAYQSLLKSTRQQYHQRIALVLQERFPEIAEAQPELLAHHSTEAGLGELAVTYWQRAGDRANRQSAYSEAIAHLNKGLLVLMTLPEAPARDDREMQLHLALGTPLLATQGNAASAVGRSYTRIQELCQGREDPFLHIGALQGLRLFHTSRAEHRQAMKIGEEALRIAQAVGDPALLAKAHQDVGVPLYYLGRLRPALEHFRQSLTHADSLPDTSDSHSLDLTRSAVICRCYVAMVLWALGYAEQAQQWCDDALTRSQRVSNLRLQGMTHMWAVHLYASRREWSRLQEKAPHLMAFSREHGLPQPGAVGTIMLAWWRVLQDHDRDGLTQLHQGIQDFRVTGGDLYRPHWLSQLAEAYVHLGQPQDALAVIEQAFDVMCATEEYLHHAKLHQLKGMVLLACSADHHAEAETCFHQALEIARSQDTKAWELRAATSLAHLWQSQGKRRDACDLLAPVYGWFTEGFDTPDLQEARALQEELSP